MSAALRPDRLRRSGAATTPRAIAQAPGATLTAIACRTEDTAAAAARDFPDVRVHLDYRELLARGDVDAVDVVVPNALHAEVGVAALEAGKDVLLEKPLAPTLEECDRLMAAAARTGRVLTIGHELRLSHQWGGIKRMIDAGDLGEPPRHADDPVPLPLSPRRRRLALRGRHVGSWILEEPVHALRLRALVLRAPRRAHVASWRSATAATASGACATTSPRTAPVPRRPLRRDHARRWPASSTTWR